MVAVASTRSHKKSCAIIVALGEICGLATSLPATMFSADDCIAGFDAPLAAALAGERQRQEEFMELIASENYVSPRVLEAQGSPLTNKYADGYPGARRYSGCRFVDDAERLAIERAKRLFGAAYANVQPYSGSQANAAAYFALMEPGETLLGLAASHGGHITHGDSSSFAGSLFNAVTYGLRDDGEIDHDEVAELALRHRPKVIVAGFSAYSRIVDWQRFREIADAAGAFLLADMAHVAGLVAAGLYPNPVPIADVTTTTTHKTLRGPRGGMILARANGKLGRRLDDAVYPCTQGGPLMHVIAAKAVALEEASQQQFRDYQRQVVANARRAAHALEQRGLAIVTGGTDNHMLLADLSARQIDAARAEHVLEAAHIAVNAVHLPSPAPGEAPRGLRIGTPAVTTRGVGAEEIDILAGWVADVLEDLDNDRTIASIRASVLEMCEAFPVYGRSKAG